MTNNSPQQSIELTNVPGIKLGTAHSASRYKNRDDLTLFEISPGSDTVAVFTKNRFCAAPVILAKKHLQQASPRYLLINAGNANAGTGDQGMANALALCETVAAQGGCDTEQVLPFSTGVIGEQLPVDALTKTIPSVFESLDENHWPAAAAAILTTDLVVKTATSSIELDGKQVVITGICKGSGMIKPNMATMLAYVATDACVEKAVLQQMLRQATDQSFNCITVDGDTSTNDACVLVATGKAGHSVISDIETSAAQLFYDALSQVMQSLAKQIIRDGEGATKFITINVSGASSNSDARIVAYTVAHSPLVKTALFASDPNWGRILAAVGRAEIETLTIDQVDISLGDVELIKNGLPASAYTEQQGARVMAQQEIDINISLGQQAGQATIWTSDLSYDYVKINAEYRS